MKLRRVVGSAVAFGTALALSYCADPSTSPHQAASRRSIGIPVQLSSANISGNNLGATLTVEESNDSVGPEPIGVYAHPTLLHVVASGAITPVVNWGAYPPYGWHGVAIDGSYNPGGVWENGSCEANVQLRFTVSGSSGYCNAPGNPANLDIMVIAQGTGSAWWNRGQTVNHAPDCGPTTSISCYVYNGGVFDVSVTKIAATVTMSPDEAVVDSGHSVTFTVTMSPSSYNGVALPFSYVTGWVFTPDSAGSPSTLCSFVMTCSWTPPVSGTVRLTVFAQGDSVTVQGHVSVNNCPPTGDPVLDNPKDRRHFFDELATAKGTNPKRERGGWMFQMPVLPDSFTYNNDPLATDCSNSPGSPSQPPGSTAIGVWHVHPLNIFDLVVTCKDSLGHTYPAGTKKGGEYGSSYMGDLRYLQNVWANQGLPNAVSYIYSASGMMVKFSPQHPDTLTWQRWKRDAKNCFRVIP